ncbi:MAG: ATP synthase F1 subunit epsilon [Treponema sp.]|nr:ATP synthase F1 subunit epsilon [Treponema sp.]
MGSLFNFEVHTPYRFFYNGKAEAITLELTDGEIGVYAKHSAFIAPVVSCVLSFRDGSGNLRKAFISSGILQVKEYKYVLMVDAAEWPEEIDRERALAAKLQAEETIKNTQFHFEKDKAKKELRRAQYRLKILDS